MKRMKTRGAVLDLGSNTIKLMLAEQFNGNLHIHKEKRYPTRLATRMNQTGRLSKRAIKESLMVLREIKKITESFDAFKLVAVGTSATRSATNSQDFLAPAQQIIRCPIRIVSGKLEGQLVYQALMTHKKWRTKPILASDLGGGSIEILAGENERLTFCRSLPLGAVRIQETLIQKLPPPAPNIKRAQDLIISKFLRIKKKLLEMSAYSTFPQEMIASGGTSYALACMTLREQGIKQPQHQTEGTRISRSKIQQLLQTLSSYSAEQLARKFHIPSDRADIITAGTLVLSTALETFEMKSLICSNRGVRIGAWSNWICSEPIKKVIHVC
ncbi:MAG: hypothetical protein AAGA18_01455 [Verrucomicrobiota bacterium]